MIRSVSVGAEDRVLGAAEGFHADARAEGAEVRHDVLPDDVAVGGHLEESAEGALGDEGVPVREALGAGLVGAVEVLGRGVLVRPDDLPGRTVDLDHAGAGDGGVVAVGAVVEELCRSPVRAGGAAGPGSPGPASR